MPNKITKGKFSKRKTQSKSNFTTGLFSIDYKEDSKNYYKQFGVEESETLSVENEKGEVLGSLNYFIKDFFQTDQEEPVKIIIIANTYSQNTRESFIAWSEELLPKVLEVKKKTEASYIVFLLSKKHQESFKHLIRPRRKNRNQLRFNHLRSLDVQMVQGLGLFAEKPLEHVKIRRATKNDIEAIAGYIKRATQRMPIARLVDEGAFEKEFNQWEDLNIADIALALSHEDKIVGLLGAFDPSKKLTAKLKLDEVKDSVFFVVQSFLKLGSYMRDLRPVFNNREVNFRFFTHIYSNNKDIFYSLVYWWINETKDQKPIFIYPHFKGELLTLPSGSLFSSDFPADLYLMQEPDDPPSSLLKPNLYSSHLDIDLPFLF